MAQRIDLTGQVYGLLTVIEKAPSYKTKGGNIVSCWRCKCQCGNEVVVKTNSLRTGNTNSCGCYRKEKLKKKNPAPTMDLTNMRFGKLVAKEKSGKRDHYGVYWNCQCDCGKITEVVASVLLAGRKKSCGCNRESIGEYQIKQILDDCKIKYVQEYTFKDLVGQKDLLRFDFALIDKNDNPLGLIECDGEQHFDSNNFRYTDLLKQYDESKDEYCTSNNLPLLRIKYYNYSKINSEEILSFIKKVYSMKESEENGQSSNK